MSETERRPGLEELAQRIAEANPKWSKQRVLSEAKQRWSDEYKSRNQK